MFVPDMPPQPPQLDNPVVIAESSYTKDSELDIGICHLIMNPPRPPTTAVNAFDPIGSVRLYFYWFEKKDLGFEGKATLLQGAKYGELEGSEGGIWGYFPIDNDYKGPDQAIFQIEIDGYRVRLNYNFNVGSTVGGGTDGYDEYDDPKLCPNGEFWRIHPDGSITPLKRPNL